MSDPAPIAVVKIGGSLWNLPDLGTELTDWLSQHAGIRLLLVAGGGPAANVVRNWHEIHSLSEEASHWLAIDSLSLTASLLQRLVPTSRLVENREQAARCWQLGETPILNVGAWVRTAETPDSTLPHSWNVTSDSLAAWVARDWSAELWLLKSTDIPEGMSLQAASHEGLVDGHFPRIAGEVGQVRWCNFRNKEGRHFCQRLISRRR